MCQHFGNISCNPIFGIFQFLKLCTTGIFFYFLIFSSLSDRTSYIHTLTHRHRYIYIYVCVYRYRYIYIYVSLFGVEFINIVCLQTNWTNQVAGVHPLPAYSSAVPWCRQRENCTFKEQKIQHIRGLDAAETVRPGLCYSTRRASQEKFVTFLGMMATFCELEVGSYNVFIPGRAMWQTFLWIYMLSWE